MYFVRVRPRECLTPHADTALSGEKVAAALDGIVANRGAPKSIAVGKRTWLLYHAPDKGTDWWTAFYPSDNMRWPTRISRTGQVCRVDGQNFLAKLVASNLGNRAPRRLLRNQWMSSIRCRKELLAGTS